jgi:hypothetical protein
MNGQEGSQDGQDGRETVASQWLRAELQRYNDSNVELNDTLLVVVFNISKLTHVFGSKVLVLVLVCYKLTLTPPSKHPM